MPPDAMRLAPTIGTRSPHAARLVALLGGPRPLVLPSAWDAGTARTVGRAGAAAIAVRGADVAWSLGHVDGEPAPCDQLIAACARICGAVDVPVLIDVSAASSIHVAQRGDVIPALIEIGAAGITIAGDDAIGVLDRRDGARVFVEVRVEADPRARPDETVQRARSYVAAGADGVLLSSRDLPSVVPIARELRAPVSVDVGDGWAPPVWGLARVGVRGIRLGGGPLRVARGVIGAVTTELLRRGTYDLLSGQSSRPLDDTKENR